MDLNNIETKEKIIEHNEEYLPIINNEKEYICSSETEKKYLLGNKYNLYYRDKLSFKIQNNIAPLLFQMFIYKNFRRPIMGNCIIFENNTNVSNESIRLSMSRLPYELIVSESEYMFNDFILEYELYNNNNSGLIHDKIYGCYIDISKALNTKENEKSMKLVLHKYITPFIVKDDDIIILDKNPIYKYWLFYCMSTPSYSKSLHMSGREFVISNNLIDNIKSKLDINIPNEEIHEMMKNNNIILSKDFREDFMNCVYNMTYKDEDDTINIISNLWIDLYFTMDFNKIKLSQIKFYEHVTTLIINMIQDIIPLINERTNNNILTNCDDETNMMIIRLKKDISCINDYNLFRINPIYNYIIRFICKINDINFGSDILILPKNKVIMQEKCIEEIEKYKNKLIHYLNKYFDNDAYDLYIEKIKLIS